MPPRGRASVLVTQRGFATSTIAVAAVFLLSLATALGVRAADDKTYVMKIALATLDDGLHQYARNYAAAVGRNSGGRIKAEIYPASQLGAIQRQAEKCSSAPSNARSSHRNSWPASTSASKFWRPPASSRPWRRVNVSPPTPKS